MGLDVTSISELDTELVTQIHAEAAAMLQEAHPEVELTRGVVHDLVVYFGGAVFGAWSQTEVNRVLESRSLLAIEEDPVLADEELADHVFSNHRVARKAGAAATGDITIIVSVDISTVISAGASFTANNVSFVTASAYTARPVGSTASADTDRVLNPLGDGTFSFSIPATSAADGGDGNVSRGTKMVPTTTPANFVTAFAGSDFSGGLATELNAEVLARLNEGVAAKAWSNRTNITALIKEQPAFEDTLHYSLLGYGNPEMERDQHWLWPVSGGGRVDVYARTRALPVVLTVEKTATYIGNAADGGEWQFALDRDDAPGFYEVRAVLLPTDIAESTSGFEITLDQRGIDMTAGTTLLPDLLTVAEGAYTRHQTTVIRFVDTETATGPLVANVSTATYNVLVAVMPLVAELQDFCAGYAVRNLAGDVAVKAAVPCFLSVNCDIQQASGAATLDLDVIKSDIAATVNALGFRGLLHASLIADVIHNYLEDKQAVGPIDIQARIRRPDGTTVILRNPAVLAIPDDPGNLVTGATTCFFLDVADIGLSLVTDGFTVTE